MEVDIALACEHKIDTTHTSNLSTMHQQATQILGQGSFKLQVASTPTTGRKFDSKLGGTMAMAIGNSKGRIISTHADEAGRWVSMTLKRTQLPPVTVITTYQVVDVDPTTVGDSTYANHLAAYYTSKHRDHPHRLRKHHSDDLLGYVQNLQATGHSIILTGNLNESLGDDLAGLSRLVNECHLIDVVADRHGQLQFTTYQRGQKVLDYILVSQDLLGSIRRCGYEPFKANIFSDHRGVFVDFSTGHLFGRKIHPLAPTPQRDINSKKPHQIASYWSAKYKYLHERDWYDSVKDIKTAIDSNEPCDELAESLYTTLCNACESAGSQLRCHPQAPYSDEIKRLRTIVRLYKLITSQLHTGYDLGDSIASTQKKLGSVGVRIPDTLREAAALHHAYQKEFRATIKEEEKNQHLRKSHLDTLAETYESHGDSRETASIIQRIKRAEATKRVYAKCRTARNLNNYSGISYLLVPDDPTQDPKTCDNLRRVDCPDEIIALLQEQNRHHFGQSANCNLTKEPLDFTMEFTGACHRAEAMLDGTFVDNLEPPTEMTERECILWELSTIFLEACQYVKTSVKDTITHTISQEEYEGKIKSWDERTSTSPGTNMHLGHLKAYWARHTLTPDSAEATELEQRRQATLDGHLLLLNYALHFGRLFNSWHMVVNATLEKDPGTPKIHRL